MGPFFEILVLLKYSSLCWMYRFLVEFSVDRRKILHLSFWGKRSGRDWKRRRRLGLLHGLLVWWRLFFVFAGWWNLRWLRLWRDLRNRHRLKCRSTDGLHKKRGYPCGLRITSSGKQFVKRMLVVKGLFVFSMEGSFGGKKLLWKI